MNDQPTLKTFDSSDSAPEDFGRGSVLIFKKETKKKKDYDVTSLGDFMLKAVLGRGTFGKVYLGQLKFNNKFYAIKSIRKDILLDTH